MKKLLSLLIVFVFLNVQSRAFSPDYGGLGLNPTGTYGGTLVPDGSAVGGGNLNGVASANSLGLFSLGIPQVGLATGSFALFIQGAAYVGDIIGFVDPNTQSFSAILSGNSTFKIPEVFSSGGNPPTFTVVFEPINVSGNMAATFAQSTLTQGTGTSTTMTGTASLVSFVFVDNNGSPIPTAQQTFLVNGVNQSGQVAPTTITLISTSSNAGG